jgi:hypothetical protein
MWGDLSWMALMASATNSRSKDADALSVHIRFAPCPTIAGVQIDTAPMLSQEGLSARDTQILAVHCDAAYRRLQSEGGLSSDPYVGFGMEPFKTREYGYYYYLDVERTLAGQSTKEHLLCPQPTNAGTCLPILRTLMEPFLAIREAERKNRDEGDPAIRPAIDALEAAFRRKLASLGNQR